MGVVESMAIVGTGVGAVIMLFSISNELSAIKRHLRELHHLGEVQDDDD